MHRNILSASFCSKSLAPGQREPHDGILTNRTAFPGFELSWRRFRFLFWPLPLPIVPQIHGGFSHTEVGKFAVSFRMSSALAQQLLLLFTCFQFVSDAVCCSGRCCKFPYKMERQLQIYIFVNLWNSILGIWEMAHVETQRSWTSRFQTRKPTAPACFSGSNWQILCFSWDEINYLFKKAAIPVKCLQPETISP